MNSDKSIAELAYQLWSERGRPHGSEEEDWLEAERQLASAQVPDATVSAPTLPAGDPPASHTPDLSHSNVVAEGTLGDGKPTTAPLSSSKTSNILSGKRANSPSREQNSFPLVAETDDVPATTLDDIGRHEAP